MGPIDGSVIPIELRERRQWLCWDLLERGGRATKVPVDPVTGGPASTTDPSTWSDFETAVRAARERGHSGVGFVFADDRALSGLDLDHVLEGGALREDLRWIVDSADTYTEVSPSGDGLHVIFLGGKPEGAGRCKRALPDGAAIELYDHGRFFTVTGTPYVDADGVVHTTLGDGNGVLARLCEMYFEDDAPTGATGTVLSTGASAGVLADDEVLRRAFASRHGREIEALYRGDTSAHGGDDSAADLALCNHLAWWTGGDPDQTDRLFRGSALMRPKWDEMHGAGTYGQMTIGKAMDSLDSVYEPPLAPKPPSLPDGGEDGSAGSKAGSSEAAFLHSLRAAAASCESGRWAIDANGALTVARKDGKGRTVVTSTPPLIAARVGDVDTGRERVLLDIRIRGEVKRVALDRGQVFNDRKIVDALSPLGANVSTGNARQIVSFLTDVDGLPGLEIPTLRSVARLGWAGGPLGPFMPYDASDVTVRCDPPGDMEARLRAFEAPKGDLGEWLEVAGRLRGESPGARAMLAASLASPLLSVLGLQPFTLYVWGPSGSGKTSALKLAASVWGDPSGEGDSYVRSFNDTDKAIAHFAAFLRHLPLFIDELQSRESRGGHEGRRASLEAMLYQLAQGQERAGLRSDRTMMGSGGWRLIVIATGEVPILSDTAMDGARNRTIEISLDGLLGRSEASDLHRFAEDHNGTAGRAFLAELRAVGVGTLRAHFQEVRRECDGLLADVARRDAYELLAFADDLAGRLLFNDFARGGSALSEGTLDMVRWLAEGTREERETDAEVAAIVYLSEFLLANEGRFADGAPSDGRPRFGKRDGDTWCIFGSTFDDAMRERGFDAKKTGKRMAAEGILRRQSRGNRSTLRFNGHRTSFVCVLGDRLDKFVEAHAGGGYDGDDGPGGHPATP